MSHHNKTISKIRKGLREIDKNLDVVNDTLAEVIELISELEAKGKENEQ